MMNGKESYKCIFKIINCYWNKYFIIDTGINLNFEFMNNFKVNMN